MAELKVVKKPNFKEKADKITDALRRTAEREGQFLRTEIVKRTQSGKGIEGGALKEYSRSYKELLIREGESTNVDLTRTQQMLGAIQSRVRQAKDGLLELVIYFSSSNESNKARWNSALRPFFGISRKQYRDLVKTFREAIKRSK